ncbi:MAG: ABC transporter transmembrane domain-containing protein [Phycisphaerae bacterium]
MIIPMLKVMMGQEGLHGYIDRKVSTDRYGLIFSAPDQVDFSDPNRLDATYHLLITGVRRNSQAEASGFKQYDYIVGVHNKLINEVNKKIPSIQLLAELASAPPEDVVEIQVKRLNEEEQFELLTLNLETGKEPYYFDLIKKLLAYIPLEQTSDTKIRAMSVVIILTTILTLIRCIATFIQKYIGAKITFTAVANLRADTFAHIIKMPIGFFASCNPSDSVSRLKIDTSLVGLAINTLLGKALREPAKAIGLLSGAIWIDWKLTLIFLFAAPPTFWAVARLGKRIKRATKKSLVSSAEMIGKLTEAFHGIMAIKVYNRQDYEKQHFGDINQNLLKHQLKISKIDAATNPIMEVLGMTAGAVALLFGIHWVIEGNLEAPEFLTLIALLAAAGESLRKGSDVWNQLQQANAAGERIYSILDQDIEKEKADAVDLPKLKNKIEFKNVFFTYPKTQNPVLNGVNLAISAGSTVAIVGPNGSGKTTLVNLLPRFYDVDSGEILIDGSNIRNCTLQSLREQFALVTQKTITFNDTIAANIAYGSKDATTEQIINAAKQAYAHEFITGLPKGYDTLIGESGAGLSGGQLQRIIIARAIIKDPPILIFDEATSQIDAESEAKIHKAIENIMHNRTCLIVAHRFSTIISADTIVVMDKGQVIASGRHEELIKTCRLYQGLYETQLIQS